MSYLRRLMALLFFAMASAAAIYCFTLFCDDFNIASTDNYSQQLDEDFFDYDVDLDIPSDQSAPLQSISGASSAVEALSEGKAMGKIISQFVSPYSAGLKYNKVYINNKTSLNIDLKKELQTLPSLRIEKNKQPQVLIVHTHTTESYMLEERDYYTEKDSARSTDNTKNIVALGKILKQELENMGIPTLHCETKHDYPQYSGSYDRAAATIKDYLKKYPSIKVVIDLHRDSMTLSGGNKIKPVTTINGKKAAQVMLVVGCQDGEVTGFPNWRENFRLAIKLQQTLEVMYPGLARAMLFTPRKYNQHLTTGSLLIEVGTEANTLEEAKYSASLIGKAVGQTLNLLQK